MSNTMFNTILAKVCLAYHLFVGHQTRARAYFLSSKGICFSYIIITYTHHLYLYSLVDIEAEESTGEADRYFLSIILYYVLILIFITIQ